MRLTALQGTGIIRLNYGHGSERYGNHECDNRGWSITLNAVPICFYAQNTKDLPKSILLAEENRGITRVGTAEVRNTSSLHASLHAADQLIA